MLICQGVGKEGGRERALPGPSTHRANIPLAQRAGGGPAPSRAPPRPSHCGALRMRREWRSSKRQVGKHHPRGPGEPEPGLGEGDVGRGLLLQVPKTEVTTPAPFRGLGHGGTQAVHVVTPIAVVTKQQLVLGGETRPAGTLGARAPETGVGGGGRGQVKGARGGGPFQRQRARRRSSLQNSAGLSKTPLRDCQFAVCSLGLIRFCGTLKMTL